MFRLLCAIHKATKRFLKSQVSQGYSDILNDTKFRSSHLRKSCLFLQ